MNLEIQKQLRVALSLWDSYPDSKDEYGNTLIKGEVVDALDVLSRMLVRHDALISERAVRRDQQIALNGTAKGRKRATLPTREYLIQRLKRSTMADLAKELNTSRMSIKNKVQGGYRWRGKFYVYKEEEKK